MHRSKCMCGSTALAAMLMLLTGAAAADAPSVQINWFINGGPLNVETPVGTDQGDGSFAYDGYAEDPESGLVLEYALQANPLGSIGGNLAVTNTLPATASVAAQVLMAAAHPLESSEMQGLVTVGLSTGPGGGAIESLPPYLWRGIIDSAIVGPEASLFWHPFMMGQTGIGSSSTQADFGIPEPLPGPPVGTNIGYTIFFTITDGDTASITSTFGVTGCAHDLDGDGLVISADLLLLLQEHWGPCDETPCIGDFDGDGEVGVLDMLDMFAHWGPCA